MERSQRWKWSAIAQLAAAACLLVPLAPHAEAENGSGTDLAEGELVLEPCSPGEERPECAQAKAPAEAVQERGAQIVQLVPVKLENESRSRCLRPALGSNTPGARVLLSTCETSTSRYWVPLEHNRGSGSFRYQLKNLMSGLCLQRRSETEFIQARCDIDVAAQWFEFQKSNILFAGDFLVTNGKCLKAVDQTEISAKSSYPCGDSASVRWRRNLL